LEVVTKTQRGERGHTESTPMLTKSQPQLLVALPPTEVIIAIVHSLNVPALLEDDVNGNAGIISAVSHTISPRLSLLVSIKVPTVDIRPRTR
jgi:hypothetical protein